LHLFGFGGFIAETIDETLLFFSLRLLFFPFFAQQFSRAALFPVRKNGSFRRKNSVCRDPIRKLIAPGGQIRKRSWETTTTLPSKFSRYCSNHSKREYPDGWSVHLTAANPVFAAAAVPDGLAYASRR
jgi:hypothetical protein